MASAGDRTLTLWIGAGYFHFSTYTAELKGAYNPNVPQNVEYKTELNEWVWTYFGYSNDLKKAFAFSRFKNRIDTREWTNIVHFRPHFAKIYFGGDLYHWSFSG